MNGPRDWLVTTDAGQVLCHGIPSFRVDGSLLLGSRTFGANTWLALELMSDA